MAPESGFLGELDSLEAVELESVLLVSLLSLDSFLEPSPESAFAASF